MTVTNEGSITTYNIGLVDYIPTGLILADADWTGAGGVATLNTAIASLAAGASTTVDITFTIDPTFQGTSIMNTAEISEMTDEDGNPVDDEDSTPGNDDVGNTNDEDDSDPEVIPLGQVFDLALIKESASAGPFAPGDDVVYTITAVSYTHLTLPTTPYV